MMKRETILAHDLWEVKKKSNLKWPELDEGTSVIVVSVSQIPKCLVVLSCYTSPTRSKTQLRLG